MSQATHINKPTVWILDDQWRSTLTKISWFFNFTQAAFPAPNSPQALEALETSGEAAGWRLQRISPADRKKTRLCNGIVLIDVNWSAAPSSETGLTGIHPREKEHFGIALAEDILASRSAQDNLELILFSHTKGSRLTAFYVDLMKRGVERLHPVVILDENSDGPLIRTYGWEACCRVTAQLLQQIPGSQRKTISDRIEQRLESVDYVQMEDFTTGQTELKIDGIDIHDLAVPFYQRSEANEAQAAPDQASRAGLQPLRDWHQLIRGQRIAFDLPAELSNQPTALIRELLRYGQTDHLNGFLFLNDIRNSRYVDPVAELEKTLSRHKRKLKEAVLFEAFNRIVSVGLGTPIRKLADGIYLPDVKSSPFQNLPPIFHDRETFDVQGSTHTPEAKISIFDRGDTGFRIKLSEEVIWDNRLIQAAAELQQFKANPDSPERLIDIFELDPENRDTLLEIVKHQEALLDRISPGDKRWQAIRDAAHEQHCKLSQAVEALTAYRDDVIQRFPDFGEEEQRGFERDLRGCQERLTLWQSLREQIETLCNPADREGSLGERLLRLLENADSDAGADALQAFLSGYFPRARGYARTLITNTLKRSGNYRSDRLQLIDSGFARIFPSDSAEASARSWLSITLAALAPFKDKLSRMSDRQLDNLLGKALGKELVSRIASLASHESLERTESLPGEEHVFEENSGLFSIVADKEDT